MAWRLFILRNNLSDHELSVFRFVDLCKSPTVWNTTNGKLDARLDGKNSRYPYLRTIKPLLLRHDIFRTRIFFYRLHEMAEFSYSNRLNFTKTDRPSLVTSEVEIHERENQGPLLWCPHNAHFSKCYCPFSLALGGRTGGKIGQKSFLPHLPLRRNVTFDVRTCILVNILLICQNSSTAFVWPWPEKRSPKKKLSSIS